MISRRHVFHLGGYDPVASETLFARFRRSQLSKEPHFGVSGALLASNLAQTKWTITCLYYHVMDKSVFAAPHTPTRHCDIAGSRLFFRLILSGFRCFPDHAKKEVDQ